MLWRLPAFAGDVAEIVANIAGDVAGIVADFLAGDLAVFAARMIWCDRGGVHAHWGGIVRAAMGDMVRVLSCAAIRGEWHLACIESAPCACLL